ncbi:hypothetical protein ZIOFF_006193 [Zingiber officinale]|uniref:Uncharacterized protein n=1 Tax=Zingiber officinale TaxID=94328 RepID=A0A8J5HNF1_ZINOF|nr:hypothetical protein ZIOFF_006193 [Zingiber officinale]
MASMPSASFSSPCRQASERRRSFAGLCSSSVTALRGSRFEVRKISKRMVFSCVPAAASYVPPTVSETKLSFLKAYKRPIPSIYNTVLQELLVQQHLMRYKKTYQYDAVFALGFVTVYEQLMEGYPSSEDRDTIFRSYITALKEDPEQYRIDAKKLEEWASSQTPSSLVDFASREGEVEAILKDISERAQGNGNFSYSRFFAIGLFRLLELANATEPAVLEKVLDSKRFLSEGANENLGKLKPALYVNINSIFVILQLCAALHINKPSVDRDLDVYRNLLSKLVQAKELLKEYVDREKKKREDRSASQKANEAITQFVGDISVF